MPSPPNPTQNHQLHLTTQAANIENKVMEVDKMIDCHNVATTTIKNWKLYKPRIDERENHMNINKLVETLSEFLTLFFC